MKKAKKIIGIITVVCVLLSMPTSAFASDFFKQEDISRIVSGADNSNDNLSGSDSEFEKAPATVPLSTDDYAVLKEELHKELKELQKENCLILTIILTFIMVMNIINIILHIKHIMFFEKLTCLNNY
ncbi:MAG: hypothetical protein U0K87_00365 [Ruminococcus sp.]|nr:hypothetical protein [Acutalibacteraceae bacterium]MEE1170787.1 hypothetical protein [Ruminococcus sp.]